VKRRTRRSGGREILREEISVARDVDYIVARAIAAEGRVVSLGLLVFFSTATGDAWLLDAKDSLALRLCRDGTREPVVISETPERFAIEWGGTFRIVGDAMIFTDNQGSSRTVLGYPTREVSNAIRKAGV
jgi:hypothetical protein